MLSHHHLPVAILLDLLWSGTRWVVLVFTSVVGVVQLLCVLLGGVLGLLLVDEVHTLGLGELVNLTTGNTGEELLGESVGDWLACEGIEVSTLPGRHCMYMDGITTYHPCVACPQRA